MDIKEMRVMTGKTQKEFAESYGIPVGTLRRWEYGESTPAPYILKMIAATLPLNTASMKKIGPSEAEEHYYYDSLTGTIMDSKGTRLKVNVELDGVKEQNLALYVGDLFEAYYAAVSRFENDCILDKKEDIIWG